MPRIWAALLIYHAIFMPLLAYAESPPVFTKGVTYVRHSWQVGVEFPNSIDKILENHNMLVMSGQSRGLWAHSTLDLMSRIFVSKTYGVAGYKKMVMGMTAITIKGPVKYNTVYATANGYIVHFKTSRLSDTSLFFSGYESAEVEKIAHELARALPDKISWLRFFLPKAYADEPLSAAETKYCAGLVDDTSTKSPTFLKGLWDCTKGVGWGVWDATGGGAWGFIKGTVHAVGDAADGAANLVMEPEETYDRAVDSMSRMFDAIHDFPKAFGEGWRALPPEIKVKAVCELSSMLTVSGMLVLLSSGAGTAWLSGKLASVLSTLQKSATGVAAVKIGASIAALTERAQNLNEVRLLVSKAGEAGKGFADTMNEFDAAQSKLAEAERNLATFEAKNGAVITKRQAYVDVVIDMKKEAPAGLSETEKTAWALQKLDKEGNALAQKSGEAQLDLEALEKEHEQLAAIVNKGHIRVERLYKNYRWVDETVKTPKTRFEIYREIEQYAKIHRIDPKLKAAAIASVMATACTVKSQAGEIRDASPSRKIEKNSDVQ